jgi:hypothetical protein
MKEKRVRRTKAQLGDLFSAVLNILGEYDERISIRHLFYRCANLGLIPKTEKAYNSFRSQTVKWRKEKLIPFVDGNRYHYGRNTFNDLGEYLRHCAAAYRLNLWKHSKYYIEVWTEKDAVAAAVHSIASDWNLRTFVCRGDPSLSSLADAAETFNDYRAEGYKPVILYLGDYDESGLAIPKKFRETFAEHHDCEVELIRVGVNEDHIKRFNLPTRMAKGARRGESIDCAVDIDAMKPADLREILAHEIGSFIDPWVLQKMRETEAAERETLETIEI